MQDELADLETDGGLGLDEYPEAYREMLRRNQDTIDEMEINAKKFAKRRGRYDNPYE